jgi:high affinity Mn2+ porin
MKYLARPLRPLALMSLMLPLLAHADNGESIHSEDAQVHGQVTWSWQHKDTFRAAYNGPRSLSPQAEKDYAVSATLFAGWRLAKDTELYLNPEVVQGVPMSNLTGLGGLSNGELQKTAGAHPKLYRARLFVRQTWQLSDDRTQVESDINQLAGAQASDRLVLTAGNLAVSDIFDVNGVAHDARTQFMNWALISHGAYDFAADARGYSLGAALEYDTGPWSLRGGRFTLPRVPNGADLDTRLGAHHGDQIELEHRHQWLGQDGNVKALAFRNTMVAGRFDTAVVLAANSEGASIDTGDVRQRTHKQGFGLSAEQNLRDDLTVFARTARSDGQSEVVAFAEIDQSISAGGAWHGSTWGRAGDTLGLALAQNRLSTAHQSYLSAGGLGFFVGDGHLQYKPEAILESYYSAALPNAIGLQKSALTLDVQHISNPGYNHDRGPVNIWSVRLHTEM